MTATQRPTPMAIRFIRSPVTALFFALLLGGLALSGRFSQSGARFLLWAAWLTAVLGTYASNPLETPSTLKRVLATSAVAGVLLVLLFVAANWVDAGRELKVAPARRLIPPQGQAISFPIRVTNSSGGDRLDQVLFIQFSPPLPSTPGLQVIPPEGGPKVAAGGLEHDERSLCFWWWDESATKCRCQIGFMYDGESLEYLVRVTTALMTKPTEMTASVGPSHEFPGPAFQLADSPDEATVRSIPEQVATLEDSPEATITFEKGHGAWCQEGGQGQWELFPTYSHGGLLVRLIQSNHGVEYSVRTRFYGGGTVRLSVPRQHSTSGPGHRVAMSWSKTGMALYLDEEVASMGDIAIDKTCTSSK